MIWRGTGAAAARADRSSRKAAIKKRVHAGVPIGILGYIGEKPVAWCSVAPRETYRESMAEVRDGDADGRVWSIVCFFVGRSVRGQGVFHRLLEAAEAYAKAQGATVLEGYPVDEDSPSYRFGGFLPSFEKAGFTPIARAGTRRYVVRKGVV
jgi:GNAT superfamily N-acetyltransferase